MRENQALLLGKGRAGLYGATCCSETLQHPGHRGGRCPQPCACSLASAHGPRLQGSPRGCLGSSTPILLLWSARLVHTGAFHASTFCGGGELEEDLLLHGEQDGDVLLGWGQLLPTSTLCLGAPCDPRLQGRRSGPATRCL